MSRYADQAIMAYLNDAMDPSEVYQLEQEVERDPALRARVHALQARQHDQILRRAAARENEVWWKHTPLVWPLPVHLAARGLTSSEGLSGRLYRLSSAPQRERLFDMTLRLDPAHSAVPRQIVLLLRSEDGHTEVLAPTSPDKLLPLDGQPKDDAGSPILKIKIDTKHHGKTLAIVLPPLNLEIPWDLAEELRWAPLMAQIQAGEVPYIVCDDKAGA